MLKMGVIFMLSIVDIKKELGKNIYLYPICSDSIRGSSIDLHASAFAWSLKTKKSIYDGNKYIVIPANDTALIYTEEAMHVTNKIGGMYHSKVSLVSKGLGHISTALDPQYVGNSIIALHNHTENDYQLPVGSEFVSVIFYYLASPDYKRGRTHNIYPGHPRLIAGFDKEECYIEWRNKNQWTVNERLLLEKMKNSDEYSECKNNYHRELEEFNGQWFKNRIAKYFGVIACALIITVGFSIPSYIVDLGNISIIFQTFTERIVLPVLLAVITSFVVIDFKRK